MPYFVDDLRLKVFWHAEKLRWITISFINEEQFKKWYLALNKLIGKKDSMKISTVEPPNSNLMASYPSKSSNYNQKAINRKSKLKKLLGSPNRDDNSEFSLKSKSTLDIASNHFELLTQTERSDYPQTVFNSRGRRLLKIIANEKPCKLVSFPFSDNGDTGDNGDNGDGIAKLKKLISSICDSYTADKCLIFYRDRQHDSILIESDSDLELAFDDWFESGHYGGAFPILLQSDQ